jgi:outer membrane lipoprotein-sorting protein
MKNKIKPAICSWLMAAGKNHVSRAMVLLTAIVLAWGTNTAFAGSTGSRVNKASPSKNGLSVAEVTRNVQGAQESAKDACMKLEMEMKDALSGQVKKVKGTISLKSSDKVFVHYTQPEEQYLYAAGSLMQMYQPSQKTVYQQRIGKGRDASPVYLGVGRQLKKYVDISRVSIVKNNRDEVELLFIPAKENAGFDRMTVLIRKKDWWPCKMEVQTPAMATRARFSDFKFNQGLKDGLFDFKPPKGVQVVEGAIF